MKQVLFFRTTGAIRVALQLACGAGNGAIAPPASEKLTVTGRRDRPSSTMAERSPWWNPGRIAYASSTLTVTSPYVSSAPLV